MSLSQNDYITFLQYWKNLQEQSCALMPDRQLFRPAEIAILLPYIFMLEVKEPDILEVRIAGTALDSLSVEPMTGRNYLDVCPPHEREQYWGVMQLMIAHACGSMLTREVLFRDGQSYKMKSMKFPLLDEKGGRQFIAGLLGMDHPPHEVQRPSGGVAKSTIIDQYFIDGGYGIPAESILPT